MSDCEPECRCCTVFKFEHRMSTEVYKGRIRDFHGWLARRGHVAVSPFLIEELVTEKRTSYLNWRFLGRA